MQIYLGKGKDGFSLPQLKAFHDRQIDTVNTQKASIRNS